MTSNLIPMMSKIKKDFLSGINDFIDEKTPLCWIQEVLLFQVWVLEFTEFRSFRHSFQVVCAISNTRSMFTCIHILYFHILVSNWGWQPVSITAIFQRALPWNTCKTKLNYDIRKNPNKTFDTARARPIWEELTFFRKIWKL